MQPSWLPVGSRSDGAAVRSRGSGRTPPQGAPADPVQQYQIIALPFPGKITEQQFPHTFSEVLRQERVQQRIDAGVEVRDQEGERREQGAEVAVALVAAGPVLPHLARVERQVAHREREHDHDEHAHHAAPRAQHVARQVAQMMTTSGFLVVTGLRSRQFPLCEIKHCKWILHTKHLKLATSVNPFYFYT